MDQPPIVSQYQDNGRDQGQYPRRRLQAVVNRIFRNKLGDQHR